MLDIPSLERQWLKYKLKQGLPYLLALIGSTMGMVFFIYFLNTDEIAPHAQIKEEISSIKEVPKIVIPEEAVHLEPSMPVIQSITPNTPESTPAASIPVALEKNVPLVPKNIPVPLPLPAAKPTQIVTAPLLVPTTTVIQPNSSKTTSIKRDSNAFDIHEMEDRFKNNSNPHLGLYIAHYHYDKGNYNEAYNYALKTNAINNTLEESWLIFTKSLVKLGRTEQARKTLQLYISQSNSEEAKNLLNTLTKEE